MPTTGGTTLVPRHKRRTPPHKKGEKFPGMQVINPSKPKRRTTLDKA